MSDISDILYVVFQKKAVFNWSTMFLKQRMKMVAVNLMKVSSVILRCRWMPLFNQTGKGEDGNAPSRKLFMSKDCDLHHLGATQERRPDVIPSVCTRHELWNLVTPLLARPLSLPSFLSLTPQLNRRHTFSEECLAFLALSGHTRKHNACCKWQIWMLSPYWGS